MHATIAPMAPTALLCALAMTFGCVPEGGPPASGSGRHEIFEKAGFGGDAGWRGDWESDASAHADATDPGEVLEHFFQPAKTPTEVEETLAHLDGRGAVRAQGSPEIDWEQVINLGRELWQVIADNAPVVSIAYDYASALTAGVASASQLDGFSDLNAQSWRVWGVNGFGMTVYDVTYTVVHQYGGSYQRKGAYLATVTVLPSNVDVLWGYTVNLAVSHVSTLNVGTAEAPVASLALELKLEVNTVIKHHTSTRLFQFRGDSAEVVSTAL